MLVHPWVCERTVSDAARGTPLSRTGLGGKRSGGGGCLQELIAQTQQHTVQVWVCCGIAVHNRPGTVLCLPATLIRPTRDTHNRHRFRSSSTVECSCQWLLSTMSTSGKVTIRVELARYRNTQQLPHQWVVHQNLLVDISLAIIAIRSECQWGRHTDAVNESWTRSVSACPTMTNASPDMRR